LNRRGLPSHQYGRLQREHRPGPIALNNIGQESCEGHIAFFFLLHTPGPADLELRRNWAARTREMSMGWRHSFRQSRSLPIAVASFGFLRQGAAPFYAAESLSRRIGQILGVLLFLLISLTSTITFAQEPSAVQKAAENYLPKVAKKFPPNRTTPCPDQCKGKQEDLNAAWQELQRFDKDSPTVRAVYRARNQEIAAQEALNEANSTGKGVTEAKQKYETAKATKTTTEKNQNINGDFFKKLDAELKKILDKINKAAEALEACEKACAQPQQPQDGGTDKGGDGTNKGGGGEKGKKRCFKTQAEKDAAITSALEENNAAKRALAQSGFKFTDEDRADPKFKKVLDDLANSEAKVKEVREAEVRADCPGSGYIGFVFPVTPHDGQTYTVTFTDSGEECTFGPSEPISTPLTPTDASFNPIPRDVVPPDRDRATDTPKTPRTDGPPGTPTAERPPIPDTPKTPTDTPKTPTDTPKTPTDTPITTADTPPPEQPKTPEQPSTTETPPAPPVTTTEATPTDDIVILFKGFKGDRKVLEQGQTGEPNKGQHIMLAFKKPEHRESGTGRPVKDDSDHDKDGVHGVTGDNGEAKLNVPAEDRALYLSNLGDKTNKYYRVDAIVMQNTGSVTEIARNATPDLKAGAPPGGSVAASQFKIGNRTFVRRLHIAPYDVNVVLASGQKIDWCLRVEPAPGLGMEPQYPGALHRELPEATVKLPQAKRLRRLAP
jgi:hypothetical protein